MGPSGSGKSTVIQLLLRFYSVSEGDIIVNGKNIKEYELYSFRKQLGLVSQEPTLFQGTVRENIEYSVPRPEDEIYRYTDISHATKFIKEWDEGTFLLIFQIYSKKLARKVPKFQEARSRELL